MSGEKRLAELWREIRDLQSAEELLSWDQETYMPPRGQEARGRVLATLTGLKHDRLTSPELQDCLAELGEKAEPGSPLEAQVREARRHADRALKVPQDLAKALAEAASAGVAAWQKARRERDFHLFRKELQNLVELKRQEAAALSEPGGGTTACLYDALLDLHEPAATVAELEPLFAALGRELAPIVEAVVTSGVTVDESAAMGHFPVADQVAFGRRILQRIGFDFERGRVDASAHPFCIGLGRDDVRLTWWAQEQDFRPNFFAFLHEGGHGLYEQGLPGEWDGTPLCAATSLGIHESQSRLWENHVGRSRGFWRGIRREFIDTFPGCGDVTVDDLWPAFHVVRPSLIRVEADEVTYNLHIVARFELEKALFSRDLEVDDLPTAWEETYAKLLGLRPGHVGQGVLQDIHWSLGLFGYFPTYTLGTLLAAQLFETANRELGDLEEAFARGEFRPLLDWLRDKVHGHGCFLPPASLIVQATGSPLSAEPFLAHVRGHVEELYSPGLASGPCGGQEN